MRALPLLVVVAALVSCSGPALPPTTRAPVSAAPVRAVALPGSPGLVRMDFIAYDPAARAVWVPAGNTAKVDVIDVGTGTVEAIDGFATTEIEAHGERRVVGPSSVAIADGVAYVGNRGDSRICAIDTHTHVV